MAEEEAVAPPQPAAGAGKGAVSVPSLQTVHVGAVSTGGGGSSAGFSPASQAGYGTEDLPRVVMRTTEVDEDSLELLAAFHQHRKREVVDFDALFRHVFLRLQTLEDAMGEPAINHEVRAATASRVAGAGAGAGPGRPGGWGGRRGCVMLCCSGAVEPRSLGCRVACAVG